MHYPLRFELREHTYERLDDEIEYLSSLLAAYPGVPDRRSVCWSGLERLRTTSYAIWSKSTCIYVTL